MVKLGKFDSSHEVMVTTSADRLVAEALVEIRRQLPGTIARVLQESESQGSVVFLALNPNGPERLSETKRLSDYQLSDGCPL